MPWNLDQRPERWKFKRNPLVNVIVQLRYHPILSIAKGIPAIQEELRKRFPKFEQVHTRSAQLQPMGPIEIRDQEEFRFRTLDDSTTVILADAALALENRTHVSRDPFFKDVRLAVKALMKVCDPVNPVRLGIRYINQVDRTQISQDLGKDVTWEELIDPEFLHVPHRLADLSDTLFANEVRSSLADGGLTLRYGLVSAEEKGVFKLDIDRYYTGSFDPAKTVTRLKGMVDDIFTVFNKAVGPELKVWMEPTKKTKARTGAKTAKTKARKGTRARRTRN